MSEKETLWQKRGKCTSFEAYLYERTGHHMDELLDSGSLAYLCHGMCEAANLIKRAVYEKRKLYVIVDYDADGIGSGAEIFMTLKKLGASNFQIIIPKRMKDGYGINIRMLEMIPDGSFILTIDNGIAAQPAIIEAKRRGMTIVILDHHQQNGQLPPADLIIDPEAIPEGWTFTHYCGAGLTYKLAEFLFPQDIAFLDQLSTFACISTIGDSVSVTGDNRNIILRGMRNLNARNCPEGLAAILDYLKENCKMEHISEYEIGFKIAPLLNAPGRLADEGGKFVLQSMFQKGAAAQKCAEKLYLINEKRRELVKDAQDRMVPKGEKIKFLYLPNFQEGLCGILAGHISEDTQLPTFVMTKASDGSVKGSARSNASTDIFVLLKNVSGMLSRYGGHPAAAGFSFDEKYLDPIYECLESGAPIPSQMNVKFYDLDTVIEELPQIYLSMQRIGIFGFGLPTPVLRIRAFIFEPKAIGIEKIHLSFKISGMKCIAFSLYEKYKDLGEPNYMTLYITLTTNWWKGQSSMQLNVLDFEATNTNKPLIG